MLKVLVVVIGGGLLLALGSGCVLGTYAVDRTNDFVDMFGVRVSANLGIGLEANVRATELFQTGAGWSEKFAIGFKGRHYGVYEEKTRTSPFIETDWFPVIYPTPFALDRRVWRHGLKGNFPDIDISRQMFLGCSSDIPFTKDGTVTDYDRRYDEVGFSVYLGMVGVDAEVRLLEVLDFVLGFFTIDPMGDDRLRNPPQPKKDYGTQNPAVKKLREKMERDRPAKKAPKRKKSP